MKFKLFPVVLTAAVTSVLTLGIAAHYQNQIPFIAGQTNSLPVNYASYTDGGAILKSNAGAVDFQNAAEGSVKAVVHIKTTSRARTISASELAEMGGEDDFFGGLFGNRKYILPPQVGSGSGVVISPDGYIVTNNHVVAGTDQVNVTFNDRLTSTAKVVATDPSTDIALLKVDEKNLPYMEFGNSDNVHLGQWVLAVGYPLTLDATVTAGIVSGKGRSLGINHTQSLLPIESFIQTDAAMNPGNSGGALVNTDGQLVGLNSAIASPTGSYAGYSYAIPSNIVRKVANDLMQYGSVQRGYIGIKYLDHKNASPEQLSALGIDKNDGVYVAEVLEGSGAEQAGIKKGDFITQINGNKIHSEPEMIGEVARYKPGDNISITYSRAGKEYKAMVELKNKNGNTTIIKEDGAGIKLLGATLRTLGSSERNRLGLKGGVLVTDLGEGQLAQQTEMRKGFVIINANDKPVGNTDELQKAVAGSKSMKLGGLYPGYRGMYYYGLNNIGGPTNEQ